MLKFIFFLKSRFPNIFQKISGCFPVILIKMIHRYFGNYPRIMGNEVLEIRKFLIGTRWNFSSNINVSNSPHRKLENSIREFTGAEHAIAVGSGGSALYLILRALNLEKDSKVITQVDNCSAVPQSIMNAHCIPYFIDSNVKDFTISKQGVENAKSIKPKAVLAVHNWGNAEDIEGIKKLTHGWGTYLIEDACLALGTYQGNEHVGLSGDVGVISFGASKPLQAGEGAVVITNDKDIANEVKNLRNWGESMGIMSPKNNLYKLSINGRISEITALIAVEQLKSYKNRQEQIYRNILDFKTRILDEFNFEIITGSCKSLHDSAFAQLVLKLPEYLDKPLFSEKLILAKIATNDANFAPITEFDFFSSSEWHKWNNYTSPHDFQYLDKQDFPGAYSIFKKIGIGISRQHFESNYQYNIFKNKFLEVINSY